MNRKWKKIQVLPQLNQEMPEYKGTRRL